MGIDREVFERLRDFGGKSIATDISFSKSKHLHPNVLCDNIKIANGFGENLKLSIKYNPETDGVVFNVTLDGNAICRLCVRGMAHGPAGRTHKHSVQGPDCVENHLGNNVQRRDDLKEHSVREAFDAFCRMAKIEFSGTFAEPDR